MATKYSWDFVTTDEWRSICIRFKDLGFEQTATYGQAAAARIGAEAQFLAIKDGDQVVAGAVLRVKSVPGLRRGICWVPSGPLLETETQAPLGPVLESLVDAVCTSRRHVLRFRLAAQSVVDQIMLDTALAEIGAQATEMVKSYHTVVVDVTRSEDEMMAGLHAKWRNHLRKSFKAELSLETGRYDALYDRFWAIYCDVSSAKGFEADVPPPFFKGLTGPDMGHVTLIAQKDGTDIGAITLAHHGTNMSYVFGATSEIGRKTNAGYFLTWNGLLLAHQRGALRYDLCGIDEAANPYVTEFKRRTNGREVLCQAYEICPPGPLPKAVLLAERARARLKRR